MSVLPLRTRVAKPVQQHDSALLEDTARGDERAFEELFTRHYAAVYAVVVRVVGNDDDAEEIVLDAFLKLYRQPELGPGANVRGWMFRVATNAAFNTIRSRRRRSNWLHRFAYRREARETTDDPSDIVVRRDEATRLRQHLAELPERQRTALLLRASGMSYAEIAEVIGVGTSSVGTILTRGERALRASWERDGRYDGGVDDQAS